MTADPEPRLRADAQRNRAQILAAAKEVFAEQGPDLPMEEIARHSGVGVGTLYRRFPDRDDLIRAVARESFATVLADARTAVAEEPTGWAALARLARRSQELKVTLQLAVLSPRAWAVIRDDPRTQELRDALLATLDGIVRTAQAEGTLRGDVGYGDIVLLLSLLLRTPVDEDRAPLAPERALVLVLDSLRAPAGTPLPGQPIPGDALGLHGPLTDHQPPPDRT